MPKGADANENLLTLKTPYKFRPGRRLKTPQILMLSLVCRMALASDAGTEDFSSEPGDFGRRFIQSD